MATQQTHIGAGQSAHLSISTTDRASSGAHLNQPGKLGTSAHLADSTKTQVKSTSELASTDKTHVKTQAGSSAHLKDGFEGAVARR